MICTASLLAVLGWHYTTFSLAQPDGYRAATEAPEKMDGAPMLFPLWEVTHIRDASVYEISKTVRGVAVEGSSDGLSVGDTVTVKGHFRASDQAVVETERIDHPLRRVKGLLSIIGLILGAGLGRRFFGWESGRVVLRG